MQVSSHTTTPSYSRPGCRLSVAVADVVVLVKVAPEGLADREGEAEVVKCPAQDSADAGPHDINPETIARPWDGRGPPARHVRHQARAKVPRRIPARLSPRRVHEEVAGNGRPDDEGDQPPQIVQQHGLALRDDREDDDHEYEGPPGLHAQRAKDTDLIGLQQTRLNQARVGEVLAERHG